MQVSLDGIRAFLTGFFKHLFRLVVHSLSFRRSVLGTTTAVLLDHVSRDRGDVTVPRRFHVSSATARTLLSGRISTEFEDLGVVQSAIKSFDSLLNLLIFCVWLKS